MMERTGLKPIDELIILAKDGNGVAFTALWDRHIEGLRAYLKNKIAGLDDYAVDDICSRSFEKAFRQIHTYDQSRSQFMTWLCTIARNTALDALEQDRRVHPRSQIIYMDDESAAPGVEGIPDQAEDALGSLIETETQEERVRYVERLPDLYREVARRRIVDGMKYNEIAECLDLELNTVKTRIRRAKLIIEELRRQDEKEEEM